MTKFKTSSIIFIAILLGLLTGRFFFEIPGILFVLIAFLYIGIVVIGVFNIRWNFFLTSYNNGSNLKKAIAITFDDGPNAQYTPALLDFLASQNLRATFFCVGENILDNNQLLKRMINEGHIIGNHSYSHSTMFDFKLPSRMIEEISTTNDKIFEMTGRIPRFFRPPFGITNPFVAKAVKMLKMESIGWSLRSLDTIKDKSKVISRIMRKVQPGDIILLHDRNEHTLSLVKEIVIWLKNNAYNIVSLDTLLAIEAYEAH